MRVKVMALVTVRRGENKLLRSSAPVICRLELPGHRRRKPVVVLRVDPEHGQVAVLFRSSAKCAEGGYQVVEVAVELVAVAASASGKIDRGLQLRGWISRESHLGESSRRD